MSDLKYAVIGINHDHINAQIEAAEAGGAVGVGFHAAEDDLAADFARRFPHLPRVDDPARLLEDRSIGLILSSAVNADRADIAMTAMRHGKDVMVDKPGMTTLDQLAAVRHAQEETGRIFSILYTEHFCSRATVKAGELIAAGAIGEVIHVTGLGPHRLRKAARPAWFFDRPRYGGILTDIASHQFEQFLFFTGAASARVLSASVANRANPDKPGLQDYGDAHIVAERAAGYVRVDWFTPDGLTTWGDGRVFILGTDGFIELRKYIDVTRSTAGDHLFLTDGKGTTYIDCADVALPYGPALAADIRDRTETAMPQARCYLAMELALKAQALAEGGADV
jgi:predicted dehydrogenase